tara:strand:+ start:320 stop:595 length:276 start_codon:yes stop_codon:yes gene_type:complete
MNWNFNYPNLIMTESIPKKPLKKGSLVFVDKSIYHKSVEALASDKDLPNYVFEGPGEILSIKEEYAQVRWRRPVPDVWFKLDQLTEYIVEE